MKFISERKQQNAIILEYIATYHMGHSLGNLYRKVLLEKTESIQPVGFTVNNIKNIEGHLEAIDINMIQIKHRLDGLTWHISSTRKASTEEYTFKVAPGSARVITSADFIKEGIYIIENDLELFTIFSNINIHVWFDIKRRSDTLCNFTNKYDYIVINSKPALDRISFDAVPIILGGETYDKITLRLIYNLPTHLVPDNAENSCIKTLITQLFTYITATDLESVHLADGLISIMALPVEDTTIEHLVQRNINTVADFKQLRHSLSISIVEEVDRAVGVYLQSLNI